MPTPSTFYYNSTNFCDATDIWTDADLTTPAADGWFQVGEVYRQKTGGVLGPCHDCPSCGTGIVACNTPVFGAGGQGVYRLNFDAGNTVGAVVVRWNPFNIPDMLTLTYDGVSSSEFSSSLHGYREGYIGKISSGGTFSPPLVNGSPGGPYPSGNSYVYDPTTTSFIISAPEAIPQVPASDVSLTTAGYAIGVDCAYAVIPKTDPLVNLVECMVYAPAASTTWRVTAFCPRSLNPFPYNPVSGSACSPLNKTMYTCSVASGCGDGTSTALGINDWAFEGYAGVTKVAAGIYPVQDGDGVTKCVTVDGNGIITNISAACAGTC